MSFHVSLRECSYHAKFKDGHRVHYGHSRLAQRSFSYVGAAECSSDVKQAFQTYAVATRGSWFKDVCKFVHIQTCPRLPQLGVPFWGPNH